MATGEIVARKHWIAYLRILLGYMLWFSILLAVLLLIASWRPTDAQEYNLARILGGIDLIVIAASLFFFVWAWMDIKRFTWTAEEERLVLRSGWVPWQRTEFGIPYDTIFESYVRFGFFDKLFGCRDCVVRRTEGVTSETTATRMIHGEAISQAINRKAKEARALRYAGPQMMISQMPSVEAVKSPAEQLRDLAALKADGTITAEEFDLIKRRVIQG
ncbi:MAG TPA: PH domain-containing protein [Edaphobacter sp.]|jgi:hypothetical protein|nr:PH domain-containing protein [Edaphobacter sp.]